MEPYEYFDRDAMFISDPDTLIKIADGKLNPVVAFTLQKLKVEGNIEKALRLKEIIDLKKGEKMTTKIILGTALACVGTDWSQYKDMLAQRKQFMLEQKHEDVYVQSFDDLKLHGVFLPAIKNNSDDNIISNSKSDKNRVVICMHGYTSRSMQDFTGLTDYYFKHGFTMLQTDARAHGEIEGKYIGFGCLDRKELLKWIDWVIEHCGSDTEIYLHGISFHSGCGCCQQSISRLWNR